MKTLLILSLLTGSAFAQDVAVTKASPTTITVTETKIEVRTENIDDLFRQLKDRYRQKELEIADRDSEIAALWKQIELAKAATVEPSADVAEVKAEVEAAAIAAKQ